MTETLFIWFEIGVPTFLVLCSVCLVQGLVCAEVFLCGSALTGGLKLPLSGPQLLWLSYYIMFIYVQKDEIDIIGLWKGIYLDFVSRQH